MTTKNYSCEVSKEFLLMNDEVGDAVGNMVQAINEIDNSSNGIINKANESNTKMQYLIESISKVRIPRTVNYFER